MRRALGAVAAALLGASLAGCVGAPDTPSQVAQALLPCVSATGYVSGVARTICVATVDGKPVEVHTADAYQRMQAAAAGAGVGMRIVSGFRTMAEQQYLYNLYLAGRGNLAARPGYSNHQSGLALDLNTSAGGVLGWLNANGRRFGFIPTVPSEAWHWEFRGAVTCTPRCESGSILIGSDCGRGDCGVYGARCVNDAMGARCVFGLCPATGRATVCLNERLLATCTNGAVTSGDCGAFAAYCSAAGVTPSTARCVSGFCVATASEVPRAHDGCWINEGRVLHCDARGGASTDPCPAGQACSMVGGRAHCAPRVCPATGDTRACADAQTLVRCFNGSAIEPEDCAATGQLCSTGISPPRCVARQCVESATATPAAHAVCLDDGRRADCTAQGALRNIARCPAGQTCARDATGVRCAAGAAPDAGVVGDVGAPTDDAEEIPPEEEPPEEDGGALADATPEDASLPDDAFAPDDAPDDAPVADVTAATDAPAADDASGGGVVEGAGCGCRASSSPAHSAFWSVFLALAAAWARRRRGGAG